AGTVQDAYWSTRKQHGIGDDDLFFKFIDELGKTHIGKVTKPMRDFDDNGNANRRPVPCPA
ncbi:MAG: hypothetical protein MN733_22160, partial [Nitrososphaera sp.]|nr:hypothetical protein [Nitrososphaera sp.]